MNVYIHITKTRASLKTRIWSHLITYFWIYWKNLHTETIYVVQFFLLEGQLFAELQIFDIKMKRLLFKVKTKWNNIDFRIFL